MKDKLIMESWRKFLKEGPSISFSGVVLDEQSVDLLKQKVEEIGVPDGFVFNTKAGEPLPHHMTIVPFAPIVDPKGKHDFSKDYAVGSTVNLKVVAIGSSQDAMAALVEPPAPISPKVSFPHITIAIPEGGKPFNSNKIPKENFKQIEPFMVSGTVEEVTQ